jgi:hypothetical protein
MRYVMKLRVRLITRRQSRLADRQTFALTVIKPFSSEWSSGCSAGDLDLDCDQLTIAFRWTSASPSMTRFESGRRDRL